MIIVISVESLFGMTPTGEHMILVIGGCLYGLSILPRLTFLMALGMVYAEGRFLSALKDVGPHTPKQSPP